MLKQKIKVRKNTNNQCFSISKCKIKTKMDFNKLLKIWMKFLCKMIIVQKFHCKMMKIFSKICSLNMSKIKGSKTKKTNLQILKIIHFNKILIKKNKINPLVSIIQVKLAIIIVK